MHRNKQAKLTSHSFRWQSHYCLPAQAVANTNPTSLATCERRPRDWTRRSSDGWTPILVRSSLFYLLSQNANFVRSRSAQQSALRYQTSPSIRGSLVSEDVCGLAIALAWFALISHAAAICVRMLFGFGVVVLSGRSSKEDYGYFEALVWRFRYVDHSMWRAFECFKDLSCTEVGFSPAWVHLELGSLRRAVCVIECDQT